MPKGFTKTATIYMEFFELRVRFIRDIVES
jgi:hypothetical protein